MKKINKPSSPLRLLLSNNENVNNLQEWIMLLTAPFQNKAFATKCLHLSSVLHKGSEGLLSQEKSELVRIDFPTTVSGLYFKTDKDNDDEGCLILSIDNKAHLSFITDNHSVKKYQERFAGNRGEVSGTYSKVARIYLAYLKELMAVPKPIVPDSKV
jgi:hypothetical protein